jgi:serine/threonine protein kinase/Tol biopolymer transport system component
MRAVNDYRGYNRALVMPLAPGTHLGPYEITAPLGAGGMGEVYRARDTRLERAVAIKILPQQVSTDLVRKQRFEREAKTISSLNHPHICVLHDIGHQDDIDYLVMECIEGETLGKRLEKGPLPLAQLLKYGAHIADALDKAHRSGVVHRDLKPGNIMLTPGGAKLLDFGLAKLTLAALSEATPSATTQSTSATREGVIVGTFQYMSPEQVEGKEVDGRSDIFSLGAVLYEMVTGKRAFEGKSQLSVVSAILEKEPAPIAAVKPMTPPALDHVVRKCLAKIPDDRWQSAADIKHELSWISQASADSSTGFVARSRKTLRTRAIAALLVLAAIVLAAAGLTTKLLMARRDSPMPVVRATLTLPRDVTLVTLGDQAGAPAISPDGSSLVFAGLTEGKQMLFLHRLDSATSKPLAGTEGGKFPFWSSDSKSIGFFADQQLKRLDLAGGPPMDLGPATDARGGTWAGDVILYSPYIYEAIYRVPASGGKPVPVTTLDRPRHTTHRWPYFLPDGKHFLYFAANHGNVKESTSGIYAGSIDGGSPKFILHTNGNAYYSSGNLLYFRDGSLMAQEFDAHRLELRAEARPITQVLHESGNWGTIASASDNGVLVFQSRGEVKYPVVWSDRSGHRIGPAPISGQVQDLRLSPDRTRVAIVSAEGPQADVSAYDLKTGARTRLTFGELVWFVAWSPDGRRVAYSTDKPGTGTTDVYLQHADGSGGRELLLSGYKDHPTDWTRDGRYLVINRGNLGSQRIWIAPMFADRKPFPLFPKATYDHSDGRVSPDGKWMAYMSAESGPGEIYVTSFPSGIGKWQVSSGGVIPAALWRPDGKELYFVALDGNMMVASIRVSAETIKVEGVRPLFRSPFLTGLVCTIFDVDPRDGQRFIGSAAPDTSTLPLNVITNWTEELKKK